MKEIKLENTKCCDKDKQSAFILWQAKKGYFPQDWKRLQELEKQGLMAEYLAENGILVFHDCYGWHFYEVDAEDNTDLEFTTYYEALKEAIQMPGGG